MNSIIRRLARFLAAINSDPKHELLWAIIVLSCLGIGVGSFFVP